MNQKELDKILDNHKLWLRTNGEEGERANLEGANLKEVNLYMANLKEANLKEVNLEEANLNGANLKGANLYRANLEEANLEEANLNGANLEEANLNGANLKGANLKGANLKWANLDFSSFPLWCGGLDVHIDDRQATQLLYHLVRNVQFSKNTSAEMKKLCKLKSIIKKANEFHRVNECGVIKVGDDNG